MKKINYKSDKGVTLTALVITVTAMIILTSVILYNAKSDLVVNKLQTMKMDIENIRGKVETYYAKYGALPVLETPYTNLTDLSNSNILGVNDGEEFYVIDLSLLENLTLTYGKDFPDIKANEASMNNYKDVYIINGKSHNIFYVQGVIINGKAHYTDYGIKDVDSEKLVLAPIQDGTSILPGNISTSNSAKYVDVNKDEAYIPKGFQIIEGLDNISEGLVISDDKGNEFVWIPVKNMNDFRRQEGYSLGNYQNLLNLTYENDRNGNNPKVVESFETIEESIAMYQSVEKFGGFFIGRYEASQGENQNAQSMGNKPTWVNIPWKANGDASDNGGSVQKAREMYNDSKYGVKSTLVYGVQWDAIMNFIDDKYISNANSNSTPACLSNSKLVDTNGFGNYNLGEKINTGSNPNYKIKNIYDIGGNAWEWTMESYVDSSVNDYRVYRGGDCNQTSNKFPVSSRDQDKYSKTYPSIGFRVALFIEDESKKGKSISSVQSYVGSYANVDSDPNGIPDGIIFADLAVGSNGPKQWGGAAGAYEVKAEPESYSLKDYYVQKKSVIDNRFDRVARNVITPQGKGKDRFYVMSLKDFEIIKPSGSKLSTFTWYSNAVSKMIDYNTFTSLDFGTGRENTRKMLRRFNGGGYGQGIDSDLWNYASEMAGDISNPKWFIPSRGEINAFANAFNLNPSNYSNFKLNNWYWCSSINDANGVWSAHFGNGYTAYTNANTSGIYARFCTTY